MRGTTMWILWLERLDVAYNKIMWHPEKLRSFIWLGLVDYGRMAWKKTIDKCKKNPAKTKSNKDKFHIQWCTGGVFAHWIEDRPHWKLIGPRQSFSTGD
jgi:hypothetical protein